MLRAFIVDDEPLARDELAYILRRTKRVDVIGEAESLEQAAEQIGQYKPDAVFLDIQLAEDSGLELAARLVRDDERPDIVFATAYDEHALKAFELNAADYILKPFDENRIRQTVEKLIRLRDARDAVSTRKAAPQLAPERTDKLAIMVDDRILLVPVSQILYIGSEEGKTVIATETGQKYTVAEPLVVFEQKLRNTPIVRVHRAYLANMDGIVEIQPWFHSTYNLMMKDGSKVPVSRTYTKELKQLIGL
ncbi:LytTR family transcriptional regulator DNA-binding domain-containing protein [Paenibacillus cisolokensis]|uniref:LytR/AlgR family response regulator transcription factor n=1 Tax=Paenibacillus cisolokensis TaxID=1658519 RepID=UPI003D2D93E9